MDEILDDPKPGDYLFAVLAIILVALGVVLIVTGGSAPTTSVRLPVTTPASLMSTREG
jgi:hypothetical protein